MRNRAALQLAVVAGFELGGVQVRAGGFDDRADVVPVALARGMLHFTLEPAAETDDGEHGNGEQYGLGLGQTHL